MKEKFLNTIENENTKRSYITIFNNAKKYEDKYNTLLEDFDKFMLLDFITNEFRGISRNSISVKLSNLNKYLAYERNNLLSSFEDDFIDSLLDEKKEYLTLNEMIDLCETNLINPSDKALMMLLYHGIKGKSHLTELRMLKNNDVNLKLKTITLPNRTVIIENDYTLEVLKEAINEKYYHKYVDSNIKAPNSFKYNLECEYLFKSRPSKANNNGLNPYSFSALTNKLFRFSNMFDTTVQQIYQSGICTMINEYQNKIKKQLTILEIDFYLKNILKLESVSANEIYNMLKIGIKK